MNCHIKALKVRYPNPTTGSHQFGWNMCGKEKPSRLHLDTIYVQETEQLTSCGDFSVLPLRGCATNEWLSCNIAFILEGEEGDVRRAAQTSQMYVKMFTQFKYSN